MALRSELQTLFEGIPGVAAVYFQPPPTVRMVYPCIVYALSNEDTKFADNAPYIVEKRYQVTVIDKDPDSVILDKVAYLPKCIYDRHFTKDNLNHDVFSIYY